MYNTMLTEDKLNIFLHKIIKYTINLHGIPYFKNKTIVDLVNNNSTISIELSRYGSNTISVNPSSDELNKLRSKFPNVKQKMFNLDEEYNINNSDVVFCINTLNYIYNIEAHLKSICNTSKSIIIECAVADTNDPNYIKFLSENNYSYKGFGCLPSASYIERLLNTYGYSFKRYDDAKLNCSDYLYNWKVGESSNIDFNKRRYWVAARTQQKQISDIKFLTNVPNSNVPEKITLNVSTNNNSNVNKSIPNPIYKPIVNSSTNYNDVLCCVYGDFSNINDFKIPKNYDFVIATNNKEINNIRYYLNNGVVVSEDFESKKSVKDKLIFIKKLLDVKNKIEETRNVIYKKVIVCDINLLLKYNSKSGPTCGCVCDDYIYGKSFELDNFINCIDYYDEREMDSITDIFYKYMEGLSFKVDKHDSNIT